MLAAPFLWAVSSDGNVSPEYNPPSLHLSLSSPDGSGATHGELNTVLLQSQADAHTMALACITEMAM